MTTINVVCGIIEKEGKVLIARRKLGKSFSGYWEFPGGKIEPGENPLFALQRELLEELDMVIANPAYLGEQTYHYDSISVHLIGYRCNFISCSFRMTDHDAWVFVQPNELFKYQIANADLFLVSLIAP